jgi:hypothetical protein
MRDLEVMEVETKIVEAQKPTKTAKFNSVFEQSRRLQSANWIAERVAAAVEGQLTNGSLPA